MLLRGTIQNGRLVLDDGESLPNGTRVEIAVQRATKGSRRAKSVPADALGKIASRAVRTGDPSLADDHDDRAHGQAAKRPKRKPRGTR
ncbi:MAG: hypothetical protein KF838_12345 [Phycisphaeraceae bacterium]|nr:MAG: hypothetical protein KF838_12345 [Phycisphaeraceae bacterium]